MAEGMSAGDLYVQIKGEINQLRKDLEKSKDVSKEEGKKAGEGFGKTFKNALAATGILVAITKVVSAVKTWTAAALKQRVAEAKVTQAVRQTGHAAGYTATQIKQMAMELQKATAIADEEILTNVSGQLLTFTNITGKAFERAQRAVLDLNAVINTGNYSSLSSQSIQLGKALEDPIRGMSALARSGITFTQVQKEQVKQFVAVNDLASAQALILDEIEAKYGGQAAALSQAQGNIDDFTEAMGDFREVLGEGVLPLVDELAGWGRNLLNALTPANNALIIIICF